MSEIQDNLDKLGITIPDAAAPLANYVGYVQSGNQVFIAGQGPVGPDGLQYLGIVGKDVSEEDAIESAKLCIINVLAQLKAACGGDLERVKRCVKLGGFVACVPEFTNQPNVINGASDLLAEILGERGKHARFAVGAPSLPFNISVEIDAVFEID